MKLNAKELRTIDEGKVRDKLKTLKKRPLYLILENVYDTYNIGGLFRLADAIGVEKLYLCGEMEIPPNSRIKKASIGTYKVVDWEYKNTASKAIQEIRSLVDSYMSSVTIPVMNQLPTTNNQQPNLQVVAIEQDKRSVPYTEIQYAYPLALVLGNESTGITPDTLSLVDHIAEIPMWGINQSLNVIVSAAIVSYHAITSINLS